MRSESVADAAPLLAALADSQNTSELLVCTVESNTPYWAHREPCVTRLQTVARAGLIAVNEGTKQMENWSKAL